jgi:hypothetical protein
MSASVWSVCINPLIPILSVIHAQY